MLPEYTLGITLKPTAGLAGLGLDHGVNGGGTSTVTATAGPNPQNWLRAALRTPHNPGRVCFLATWQAW